MPIRSSRENNKQSQVQDGKGLLQNTPGSRNGVKVGVYLFLVAISLAVFCQTLRYQFVNFDDDLYVYNTPAIQSGLTLKSITAAFINQHAHNWHPLTTISHMVDCQLYGLNAGGHHATNVILHTIAVLLLFWVLEQMTGATWRSALIAALFAVHPLHVESVAWVSERKDILSAVFFFLMLYAYTRYSRAPSLMRYVAVVLLFAAGLMSKPMLVTAPIILLFLDYWPLHRFEQFSLARGNTKRSDGGKQTRKLRRIHLEKIPLFVLSAVASILTFVLQKRTAGAIPPLPLLWRVQNALVSYVIYLWKTLWPVRLAVFYPHPNDTLPLWEVSLAILLLLAITSAVIVFRKQRPYLLTGWFWYVIMLMPVIGIIQVGEQGHADRYTYLPHVGLFVAVVWFAVDIAAVRRSKPRVAVITGAAVLVILALAWVAFIQASYWRSSETLWTHALAVTSDNDVAHNNLGYLCNDRGELDEAISHFESAAKIRSGKRDPHYDLASAFVQMNLGDALAKKGRSDEAIEHYDEAVRFQPDYADAYYNRGAVLLAKGRVDEAIADLAKAVEMHPNDADAHTSLGNALLQKRSLPEAIAQYATAMDLAPQDPHSRNNLAWILATASNSSIRDGAKAVGFAEEAVQLSSGKEPLFLRTLAAAYAESGRYSEAIAVTQQAANIANMQGNPDMAKRLKGDLVLYHGNVPLRENSSGD